MTVDAEISPRHKWFWVIGTLAFCSLSVGAIWWRDSYQEYLNAGFRWETIPLLSGAALFLSWFVGLRIMPSAVSVGAAFSAVVLARVVLDALEAPTRHNLWPMEAVMALGLGTIIAYPSAAAGWLLRRVTQRRRN